MNKLVEWKAQLQLGTQVRQIWNARERDTDHLFTITKIQSNGVFSERSDQPESRYWMEYPPRGEIEFTENGWRRFKGDIKVAEYVWVEKEEHTQ